MLTLPTALLLMLVAFLRLHSQDRTLTGEPETPSSSGGRLTDVVLDHDKAAAQGPLAPPRGDEALARVFGPLQDDGFTLVGTCAPQDEPAVDDVPDDLLGAHASALLRCTLWTGVEAGGGGADDLEARAVELMAADLVTDIDGARLLGLGLFPESPTADIAGLMPMWALSGPVAWLPAAAHADRSGMTVGAGGGTGGAGGGTGGGASGLPRASRTPADDDVVSGGEPETPSDDSLDADDALNTPDANVGGSTDDADEGTPDETTDGSPEPSNGGSTALDVFPPRGITPPPSDEPGGGSGDAPPQTQSVPEPATILLAGAGLAALMITRRPRV